MSIFKDNHKYLEVDDFFKLKNDGDVGKIRIVSESISGWTLWKDKKPTRFAPEKRPRGEKKDVKKFIAMVVWNHDYGIPQVWEVSQLYLMDTLKKLESTKGSLFNYDLEITRFGEETDTRYTIKPMEPLALSKDAKETLRATPCNLYAMYVGKEPFVDLDAGKEVCNESIVA